MKKACEKDFARFFHGEGKWKENKSVWILK